MLSGMCFGGVALEGGLEGRGLDIFQLDTLKSGLLLLVSPVVPIPDLEIHKRKNKLWAGILRYSDSLNPAFSDF